MSTHVTSQNVIDVRFSQVSYGYDKDEVDTFLEDVRATLREYEEDPYSILALARKTAQETVEKARDEATLMVEQARATQTEMVKATARERQRQISYLESLKAAIEEANLKMPASFHQTQTVLAKALPLTSQQVAVADISNPLTDTK